MLELKVVVPNKLAVMSQPTIDDVKALAEQGYRSIINNRPDNEKPDQPKAADVRAAAKQHGLHYEHMPLTVESITREDVLAFRQSFTLAPPPWRPIARQENGPICSGQLARLSTQTVQSRI
jgi:uncharacterized protein (TIGR01244 family)